MRLINSNSENIAFAHTLLKIRSNQKETVELPTTFNKCTNLDELICSVYPHLEEVTIASTTYLTERTILSACNEDVNIINIQDMSKIQGQEIVYLAVNKLSEADAVDRTITNRYPQEYMNSLDPSGLPPFRLRLKVGCGLCNGTRLMVVKCSPRLIESKILTGFKTGKLVFIPTISLTPMTDDLPFSMTRRQFPLRLDLSMTINKSQCQFVKFVGIYLTTSIFSHGQLYVALSRCTSPKRISVLLAPDVANTTMNVVYSDVLL
ncbi:hypothetical protein GIB67_042931 [Kingdonia uniflora]|uniref:ATP-dependent DNA helicase n=1 Tax=Kingdonia uniflora TaxID=39325 RepID=A0A7J7L5W7_9MAGN|nr:hypothetical protein GIB67_042931 [Kingdonia uniflora]